MSYVDEVIEQVVKQNPAEPEFHQAVKEVGKGLRIMGKADDGFGTIEALEHETLPIFSVQWHPERMCFDKARSDTIDGRYLIEKFVKMCK